MAQWPASPVPNSIKISSIYPTIVSTAQSLKQQVRSRGGQRWKIELAYVNLLRAQLAILRAADLGLRGQFNVCTLAMISGIYDTAQGTWSGTPKVNGANQVGRTLNAKGFAIGQSGVAKADDFVQFSNDPKVYSVIADANSDGSGNAALSLEPALMQSPQDNTNIIFGTSILFTLARDNDLSEFPMRPGSAAGVFNDFSISMIERC